MNYSPVFKAKVAELDRLLARIEVAFLVIVNMGSLAIIGWLLFHFGVI